MPVPLLPQTERIESMRAVHGQDPVEVVDLVLNELGPVTLEVHLRPFPLEVLIANPNPVGTGDPDEKVGEREAVVPDREILVADVHDLGIDERPGRSISI